MSVSFDSVDDRITCGTADVMLQENSAQSVSAWIYPFSFGTSNRRIINRNSTRFEVRNSTTGQIAFALGGVTTLFRISVNNTLVVNSWQHVSYTWTGTTVATEVNLYVNGGSVSYVLSSNGATPTDNATAATSIGANSTGGNVFTGYIAEVAVWNTVLTVAQVSTLALGRRRGLPLQVQTANLVSYWPLEDVANGSSADGATFRDVFGTNTGTGDNGANNTGLTGTIGEPLSYLVHVDKNRGIGRGLFHGGIS